jgi:uncharacterized membrane protein YvlD (DUF360 family)
MIRKIAKLTLLFTFCLITQQQIWANLDFSSLPSVLIKTAVILAFFETIIKPIIKILLLPINILTLGTLRLVISTLGLYLAVFLLDEFSLYDISTVTTNWQGIIIPAFHFSGFLAYLVSTITINLTLAFFSLILYKKRKT